MNVVVVGELSFAQELGQLSIGAGHRTRVQASLDREDASGRKRLQADLATFEIVIELQNRSIEAKQRELRAISQVVPEKALVLSLTFATGVTEAASYLHNPQRLVGFGLVPPLDTPGKVEIASGLQTVAPYLDMAIEYWQSLDLEAVQVGEGPGLVRARALCCLINEAASALMEDVASADDIDAAMQLGTNYPYGPLEWADLIGLENVYAVMSGLYREWGEDRYRPSPLLKRLILAGRLGRVSGRGFYTYELDGSRVDRQ